MLCNTWFRKINLSAGLIASLAFLWSCSEGPAPGPMSPLNSGGKSRSAVNNSGVRPIKRQAPQALAKSGYDRDKVVEALYTVRDEAQVIVNYNPGTGIASLLAEVVKKSNEAVAELAKSGDDKDDDEGGKKALEKIKKAKEKIQEAMKKGLMLTAQGYQFLSQFAEVESQINDGYTPSVDCRGNNKSLWIRNIYGGMIKFCGHSIQVPKYATKQDAEFSISVSPNDYITVDFGPDGYFEQYLTVTVSYKDADLTGIDPTKLTLAWYDEKAGQWIDLGGVVDLVKKTVTAKNNHFTQYTLATK